VSVCREGEETQSQHCCPSRAHVRAPGWQVDRTVVQLIEQMYHLAAMKTLSQRGAVQHAFRIHDREPAPRSRQRDGGARKLDTQSIEQQTGAKGKLDEKEGAFKVSVPRSDLQVVAGGVKMVPALGLTSWAAFKRAGAHTVVMGDLVLTEDQVNPVMNAALDSGLEVTALHNHFFWDAPKIMFMHIGGMGAEAPLPQAVAKPFAPIPPT